MNPTSGGWESTDENDRYSWGSGWTAKRSWDPADDVYALRQALAVERDLADKTEQRRLSLLDENYCLRAKLAELEHEIAVLTGQVEE